MVENHVTQNNTKKTPIAKLDTGTRLGHMEVETHGIGRNLH